MSEENRPGGIEEKSPSARAKRGDRRLIVIFILVPVLAALGLAAHGFLFRDPKVLEERRLREPLREGVAAPDFTLPDLSGNDISLSDYRGKQGCPGQPLGDLVPPLYLGKAPPGAALSIHGRGGL